MKQFLIALDQTLNTIIGGMADETVSARAYRKGWKKREALINWLFRNPDHCRDSYHSELMRKHLPDEYR